MKPGAIQHTQVLYKVRDIAKATGASSQTVHDWINDGLLIPRKRHRIRGYSFSQADFEQLLAHLEEMTEMNDVERARRLAELRRAARSGRT